jgi:hypothetical protein
MTRKQPGLWVRRRDSYSGGLAERRMDADFLQRHYSSLTPKRKSHIDFHRWKEKVYAKSKASSSTKPGTGQ